jgi:putative restriction endonuclease
MTSVSSPLPQNPAGPTVLIGWHEELNMFAGFDISKHRTFTTGSPSVQVDGRLLHRALQNGLSFGRKENAETTVAFRPDQFVNYIENAPALHLHGADARIDRIFNQIANQEPVAASEIESLPSGRQKVIRTVSRLTRAANFKDRVLGAYGKRCAVTRMQLKLLDAAHILPVGADNSSDDVTNGLSLMPTYHRAYDRGLIFLDEHYTMRLNAKRSQRLTELGVGGGLADFSRYLGKTIHLPADVRQRPSPKMIRAANRFRGVG